VILTGDKGGVDTNISEHFNESLQSLNSAIEWLVEVSRH
jgi:hypothetical protein